MSSLYRLADGAAEMAALGTRVEHIGCFRACLDSSSNLAALNYAVPWASPWSYEQVRLAAARLTSVFQGEGRLPRVSFVREAWPWLAPVLGDCGFALESSIDLMICTPETRRPTTARHAVSFVEPDRTGPFVAVQNEVFPQDESDPALVRYQIANGFWRCAIAYMDGSPAAAGSLVPQGRLAELAAMATIGRFRRRGLATAIAAALIESHFEAGGDLVWLGAANPAAVAVYEPVGFRAAGSRVTYALA